MFIFVLHGSALTSCTLPEKEIVPFREGVGEMLKLESLFPDVFQEDIREVLVVCFGVSYVCEYLSKCFFVVFCNVFLAFGKGFFFCVYAVYVFACVVFVLFVMYECFCGQSVDLCRNFCGISDCNGSDRYDKFGQVERFDNHRGIVGGGSQIANA